MQQMQEDQQEMATEQPMFLLQTGAETEAADERRASSPLQQTPTLASQANITTTQTASASLANGSGEASKMKIELVMQLQGGGVQGGASVCSLSDAEGPQAHIATSDLQTMQLVLPSDGHAADGGADAASQQASRTESVSSAGVPPRAIPAALTGRSRRQSTVDSSRATASLQSYRSSHPQFDGRPYKEQQKAAKQFREEIRSRASAAKSPALMAAPSSASTVTSSSMMGSVRVEQQAPEQVQDQEDGRPVFRPRSSSLSSSDGDVEMHSEAQLSGRSTSPEPRSTPSISPRLLAISHRQEAKGARATSRSSGSNRSGRGRATAARGGGSVRGRSRARAQSRSRSKRKRQHNSDSESEASSSDSSWYEEMPRSTHSRSRSNSGEPSSFTVMAQLVSPTPGPSSSTRSGRGSKRAYQESDDIDFDTRQHVPWQGKDVPLTAETVRSVEQATLVEAPAPSAASFQLPPLASPPQSAFAQVVNAMPVSSGGNFLQSPVLMAPLMMSPTLAYSLNAAFRPSMPMASPPPYAHFVQPSPPPLFYAPTGQGNAATLVDARQSFSPPLLAPPLGSPLPQTPAAAAAAAVDVPSRLPALASPPSLEFTAGLDLEAYAVLPQAATYDPAPSLGASSSGSNASLPGMESVGGSLSGRDSAMSSGFRGVSASPLRQLISPPQEFFDPPRPDDYLSAPCVTPAQAIELLKRRDSPQLLDSTFAHSAPCVFRPFNVENYRQYLNEQKRRLEERQQA